MEQQLQEHEKITPEMYNFFSKVADVFLQTMKEGIILAKNASPNDGKIILSRLELYQNDLAFLISKIKEHYSGNVVEYDFSEITMYAAMIHIYEARKEPSTRLIGRIFNTDVRYAFVFDNMMAQFKEEKKLMVALENLLRKFSKKSY